MRTIYTKRTTNAFSFYGCNLTAQWPPTCFGHSCGHLQGGEKKNTYTIKTCLDNSTVYKSFVGLLIYFIYLINVQNMEHSKLINAQQIKSIYPYKNRKENPPKTNAPSGSTKCGDRHHAPCLKDRLTATPQSTLFMYLVKKYI